jgi:hypothetical protein
MKIAGKIAKKIAGKIVMRIIMILILLAAGFALGFPIGQQNGFATGSEWAIVQADIAAREAGVSMPVSIEEGQIHVVIKQPTGIYKRAQQAALRCDRLQVAKAGMAYVPIGLED